MPQVEVLNEVGRWTSLVDVSDESQSSYSEEGGQVIRFGYSIFDYLRQYDMDWISALEALKHEYLASHNAVVVRKRKKKRSLGQPNPFPPEMVFAVLSYVDHETLLEAGQVNRTWRCLANDSALWQRLLVAKYGLSAETLVQRSHRKLSPAECNPKEMYRTMFLSFRKLLMEGGKFKQRPAVPASALGSAGFFTF